jgi:hypothetical protein
LVNISYTFSHIKSTCRNRSIRCTHCPNKHPRAHHGGMPLAMPTSSKTMHTLSQQASSCASCGHAAHPDSILARHANCIFYTINCIYSLLLQIMVLVACIPLYLAFDYQRNNDHTTNSDEFYIKLQTSNLDRSR